MIYWAVIFFIVAIVAGLLGFGGIVGASFGAAQTIFFVFLALLAVTLLAGLFHKA